MSSTEESVSGQPSGFSEQGVPKRKRVRIKIKKKKKKFKLSELTELSPRTSVVVLLFLVVLFMLSLYYIIVYLNTQE